MPSPTLSSGSRRLTPPTHQRDERRRVDYMRKRLSRLSALSRAGERLVRTPRWPGESSIRPTSKRLKKQELMKRGKSHRRQAMSLIAAVRTDPSSDVLDELTGRVCNSQGLGRPFRASCRPCRPGEVGHERRSRTAIQSLPRRRKSVVHKSAHHLARDCGQAIAPDVCRASASRLGNGLRRQHSRFRRCN